MRNHHHYGNGYRRPRTMANVRLGVPLTEGRLQRRPASSPNTTGNRRGRRFPCRPLGGMGDTPDRQRKWVRVTLPPAMGGTGDECNGRHPHRSYNNKRGRHCATGGTRHLVLHNSDINVLVRGYLRGTITRHVRRTWGQGRYRPGERATPLPLRDKGRRPLE